MKFYITLIVSLFLTGCVSTWTNTQHYNWSDSANYSELRNQIGWSDDYDAICSVGRPLSKMSVAMTNKQWEEAVELGNSWLNKCPIDMRIHYYMGMSLEQLGRENESNDHFRWMSGFMDALVASGDGKSPETAYEVISVSEEYDAIYIFGLKTKSQALVAGKIQCDLITAIDDSGNEVSIYFNPAAHFARMAKIFK